MINRSFNIQDHLTFIVELRANLLMLWARSFATLSGKFRFGMILFDELKTNLKFRPILVRKELWTLEVEEVYNAILIII